MPKVSTYLRIRLGLIRVHGKSPLEHRFWWKVDKDGDHHPEHGRCWHWKGALVGGYGMIMYRGKTTGAHRMSYRLHFGPISDGIMVLHKCDNPRCVNPAHLFLGSRADNNADRERKGRGGDHRGLKNGRAILTEEQVRYIRSRYRRNAKKGGVAELAHELGVNVCVVSAVARGATWRHVT